MTDRQITAGDVLDGIQARIDRNDPESNSTWNAATRSEIATELKVPPDQISREGGTPDGPLGEAVEAGDVVEHPNYPGYWMLAESARG